MVYKRDSKRQKKYEKIVSFYWGNVRVVPEKNNSLEININQLNKILLDFHEKKNCLSKPNTHKLYSGPTLKI
jgi:hypothetical protein